MHRLNFPHRIKRLYMYTRCSVLMYDVLLSPTGFSDSQDWFCGFGGLAHSSFVLSTHAEHIRLTLFQVTDLQRLTGSNRVAVRSLIIFSRAFI